MLNVVNFFARWMLVFQSLKKSRLLVSIVRWTRSLRHDWNLVQRFTAASSVIMLLGMIGIGRWVGERIKEIVISETTLTTALYMDSFISPNVQELFYADEINPEHIEELDRLFGASNLGQKTVSIKIWNHDHTIAYSNIPALLGHTFPDTADQLSSWQGHVTGEISSLDEAENVEERQLSSEPLLEVYSPVRLNDTDRIIAVAEFYQKVDTLNAEIVGAQREGWAIVGLTMLFIYLTMLGFVQLVSARLERQDMELREQVARLTGLLASNRELTGHVRKSAAGTVALNESLLRRVSAELHDGPVQEISLALLRLDQAIAQNENCSRNHVHAVCTHHLPVVQETLQSSLRKMRSLAAWFGLPQLERFSLADTILHVVHAHEQRLGVRVLLEMQDLPEDAPMSVKIVVYRFIQDGLNHLDARERSLSVRVACVASRMMVEVTGQRYDGEVEIGLDGMRERIESLGGRFSVFEESDRMLAMTAYLWTQPIGENLHG